MRKVAEPGPGAGELRSLPSRRPVSKRFPASAWRGQAAPGHPPPPPSLALLSGLTGAQWGAMGRRRGSGGRLRPSTQRPTHSAGKIAGTISGVLKEPPGFAHLTEDKRPTGAMGFLFSGLFSLSQFPCGRARCVQLALPIRLLSFQVHIAQTHLLWGGRRRFNSPATVLQNPGSWVAERAPLREGGDSPS